MDILGSIGQLYTFILLVLLFLGAGLAVWAFISSVNNSKGKPGNKLNEKIKNNKIIGGISMKGNGFIKLAVFSFVGIIISVAVLTALPNNSMSNMNNMNMNNMNNMSNMDSIQQQLNNMQMQLNQMQQQMNGGMQSGGSMSNMSNGNSGSSSSGSGSMSMPMM